MAPLRALSLPLLLPRVSPVVHGKRHPQGSSQVTGSAGYSWAKPRLSPPISLPFIILSLFLQILPFPSHEARIISENLKISQNCSCSLCYLSEVLQAQQTGGTKEQRLHKQVPTENLKGLLQILPIPSQEARILSKNLQISSNSYVPPLLYKNPGFQKNR